MEWDYPFNFLSDGVQADGGSPAAGYRASHRPKPHQSADLQVNMRMRSKLHVGIMAFLSETKDDNPFWGTVSLQGLRTLIIKF